MKKTSLIILTALLLVSGASAYAYTEGVFDQILELTEDETEVVESVVEEEPTTDNDEDILKQLLDNGEVQSALFLSRRLIANGEEWAQQYYDIAMSNLS